MGSDEAADSKLSCIVAWHTNHIAFAFKSRYPAVIISQRGLRPLRVRIKGGAPPPLTLICWRAHVKSRVHPKLEVKINRGQGRGLHFCRRQSPHTLIPPQYEVSKVLLDLVSQHSLHTQRLTKKVVLGWGKGASREARRRHQTRARGGRERPLLWRVLRRARESACTAAADGARAPGRPLGRAEAIMVRLAGAARRAAREACLRHLRCPRALSLGGDALLAPECAVAVRVAMRWVAAPPMAALGHARVADEAVASRLVAIDGRRDQPLGRMEGVERAERPLVRQVLVLVWTVFLRYLDVSLPYLTVSPRISLHLLASPRISPYLPVSARISYLLVSPGISRYLPVSPGIPPYPAISRHIPPRIPRKKPSTPGMVLGQQACTCKPEAVS